jgi:hypothetical protein
VPGHARTQINDAQQQAQLAHEMPRPGIERSAHDFFQLRPPVPVESNGLRHDRLDNRTEHRPDAIQRITP